MELFEAELKPRLCLNDRDTLLVDDGIRSKECSNSLVSDSIVLAGLAKCGCWVSKADALEVLFCSEKSDVEI